MLTFSWVTWFGIYITGSLFRSFPWLAVFLFSGVSSLAPLNDWTRVGPNLLHGDLYCLKGPCLFHDANIRRVPEGTLRFLRKSYPEPGHRQIDHRR